MKKIKQFISVLLMTTLISTVIQPTIFATDTNETSEQRAKINMVFLGKSAADDIWDLSDDTLTITTPPTDANTWTANPTTGTIFWVGLTLSDMAKMDATAGDGADATDLTYKSKRKVSGQEITTVSHFTRYTSAASNDSLKNGGIFFIGAGIEYASKYVKPVYITDNDTEEDANNVAKNTIGDTMRSIEARYAKGSYTVNTVNTTAALVTDDNREASTIAPVNEPKLFYLNMQSGEGVDKKIFGFKEDINDDPLCILAIPFRLVEMPPKGTKLFQAALNPANFEIQTGASSTGQDIWKASWNASREVLTDRNLKNHFDYGGDLNLFPTMYTVEFYNSKADAEAGTNKLDKDISDIPENTAVKDVEDATIPGNSDFTAPEAGKFPNGLKYIDASGNETSFTEDTVLDTTSVAEGSTTLKVYADWKDGHTITFHQNHSTTDTTTKAVTVSPDEGTKLTDSDYPAIDGDNPVFTTPDGYAFKEWNTQSDGNGTKITNDTDVSGISDIYAIWSEKINVTFHKNDGTNTTNVVPVTKGGTFDNASDIPTYTRDNYDFKEWNTKSNGSGTTYTTAELGTTTFDKNTNLYAMWTATGTDKVTLNFDAVLDGVTTDPSSITKNRSDKVYDTDIPEVSKDCYTFDGWYKSAAITDTTKILPNADGYTLNPQVDGEPVSTETLFGHWTYKDENTDKVKVTFMDGETTYAETTVPANSTLGASMPANPTKSGYAFNKWTIGEEETGTTFTSSTSVGASDITVYAHYLKDVTYTFDQNYTGAPAATTVTKTAGEKLGTDAPANPTRTTYDFVEWNTETNGSGTKYDATNPIADLSSLTDQTLYAIWKPKSNQATYTLTFDATGGTLKTPTSITVVQGDPITAAMMPGDPTKTKAGDPTKEYKFGGWFKDASPSNTAKFETPITLEEDTTAYAHWSYEQDDAITITFDDQGATTAVSPSTIKIAPGDAIGALPTDPAKTSNSFSGWYLNADGSGDKITSATTFDDDKTVYAKWTKDITVKFDVNTGTGTVTNQTGKQTDNLTLPADGAVTKSEYKLVGWNTEKNGSGKYAASTMTLSDIYAVRSDKETEDGVVTLYAQWAYVPDGTEPDDPSGEIDVDPKKDGVHVKFNSNAAGHKNGVVEAKPKDKYPKYGEAIGTDQMPNDPSSTNYVFKGWNTKPNGSGEPIDGNTVFDKNGKLKDYLKEIDLNGTDKAYEITVYAQWDIDPNVPADKKVNIILNKNDENKGIDANPKTITIYKGDSLGYVPEGPANTKSSFVAWYTGEKDANGYINFGTLLKADTTFEAPETTYYAKWNTYIALVLHKDTEDDKPEDKFQYTGEVITPNYDVYYVRYTTDTEYELLDPIKDIDLSDFIITYEKNGEEVAFKDAGTYSIDAELKETSALKQQGVEVAGVRPTDLTIKPVSVTVKIDPDTQTQKKATNTPKATITVDGLVTSDSAIDTSGWFKYNIWDDKEKGNKDGIIQENEVSEATGELAVGKYVIKAKSTNENYTIGKVESSNAQQVHFYERTASADGKIPGYPDAFEEDTDHPGEFKLKEVGQNIFFEVIPSDPSINSIEVKTKDKNGAISADPLPLKKSDYKEEQAFDNSEKPTVTNYYARISAPTEEEKEAGTAPDKIQFTVTLTNPDTTTLEASNGETADDKKATVTPNDDGTYTITAPINKKGKDPNVITITTKSGNAADAPTITYTFNVQQLVEAKIVLNYGNSPVGEIMRGSGTDAEKEEAINNFKETRVFSGVSKDLMYYSEAWNSYIVRGENDTILSAYDGDLDPTALFVFQRRAFTDPGFELYDGEGELITDTEVIGSVKLSLSMNKFKGGFVEYTDKDEIESKSTDENAKGNNYVFSDFISYDIRPDVYELEYSFEDPITGKPVTEKRKVIAISKHGDVSIDANNTLQGADATEIVTHITIFTEPTMNSLYKFRIADTDINENKVIQGADATEIKTHIATGLPEFYKEISNEGN